jgi:SLOG cluster2
MVMRELHRYSRRDRPFRIYLAWQEHRKLAKAEFDKQLEDLGLFGEIVCLDPAGKAVAWGDGRGANPEPVTDATTRRQALSALRAHMAQHENGRVVVGGKRTGFEGAMPGVLEEAITSVAKGQPLYVAGGFGGVAADIAMRIGMLDAKWLPALADAPAPEVGLFDGLDKLSMLAKDQGWPKNGLSDAENAQLAATHRPSEIAALVSLGLGRRFSKAT